MLGYILVAYVEVEVLKANKENVVLRAERVSNRKPKETDERSGLLISAVLRKTGNDIADGGMEGISLADSLDERLRSSRDGIHALRLLQRVYISLRHLVDSVRSRKLIEQPLTHDCKDFAGILLNWRDRPGVAIIMLGEAFNKRTQLVRAIAPARGL